MPVNREEKLQIVIDKKTLKRLKQEANTQCRTVENLCEFIIKQQAIRRPLTQPTQTTQPTQHISTLMSQKNKIIQEKGMTVVDKVTGGVDDFSERPSTLSTGMSMVDKALND